MTVPRWLLDITRGHGIGCMLLGCRRPYWHGRNYARSASER